MDFLGLLDKIFGGTSFPPAECILEVRMGGMLVNFGLTTADDMTLEHLSWIYQLIDPEAELLVTCLSFMV